MNKTIFWTEFWMFRHLTSALVASCLISTVGCVKIGHEIRYSEPGRAVSRIEDPYYHSHQTGRIVIRPKKASKYCYAEPAFYGFEATCWQRWPDGWVGCPCQEEIIETVAPEARPEVLPTTDADQQEPSVKRHEIEPAPGTSQPSPSDRGSRHDAIEPLTQQSAPQGSIQQDTSAPHLPPTAPSRGTDPDRLAAQRPVPTPPVYEAPEKVSIPVHGLAPTPAPFEMLIPSGSNQSLGSPELHTPQQTLAAMSPTGSAADTASQPPGLDIAVPLSVPAVPTIPPVASLAENQPPAPEVSSSVGKVDLSKTVPTVELPVEVSVPESADSSDPLDFTVDAPSDTTNFEPVDPSNNDWTSRQPDSEALTLMAVTEEDPESVPENSAPLADGGVHAAPAVTVPSVEGSSADRVETAPPRLTPPKNVPLITILPPSNGRSTNTDTVRIVTKVRGETPDASELRFAVRRDPPAVGAQKWAPESSMEGTASLLVFRNGQGTPEDRSPAQASTPDSPPRLSAQPATRWNR